MCVYTGPTEFFGVYVMRCVRARARNSANKIKSFERILFCANNSNDCCRRKTKNGNKQQVIKKGTAKDRWGRFSVRKIYICTSETTSRQRSVADVFFLISRGKEQNDDESITFYGRSEIEILDIGFRFNFSSSRTTRLYCFI